MPTGLQHSGRTGPRGFECARPARGDQPVGRAPDGAPPSIEDVGVDHRRAHVCVAEEKGSSRWLASTRCQRRFELCEAGPQPPLGPRPALEDGARPAHGPGALQAELPGQPAVPDVRADARGQDAEGPAMGAANHPGGNLSTNDLTPSPGRLPDQRQDSVPAERWLTSPPVGLPTHPLVRRSPAGKRRLCPAHTTSPSPHTWKSPRSHRGIGGALRSFRASNARRFSGGRGHYQLPSIGPTACDLPAVPPVRCNRVLAGHSTQKARLGFNRLLP